VEYIENDYQYPGKIVWANTGDADGDGLPDYANAYGYDLRAHHPGGQCPECGTVIPATPSPPSLL
jgi:hypothetical protein